MEDFEIGAYDSELYYSKRYEDWLELRKNQVKLYPYDYHTRYRYAEALIETKKYKFALDYLKQLHDEDPEEEEINQLILDTLRKYGQTKEYFNWKISPVSFKLNEELELLIIEELKSKKKRKQKLNDTFLNLMNYLLEFDEIELYDYLKTSKHFKVSGDEYYDAIIERIK